jgi:hypothetical protein
MKTGVILGLMLLATAVAVALHNRKRQYAQTEIKTVQEALLGIDKYLKPEQSLLLFPKSVPFEAFFYVRLALAPRHTALYDSRFPPDTLLLLKNAGDADTTFPTRTIIWQQTSGRYCFQLLRTK